MGATSFCLSYPLHAIRSTLSVKLDRRMTIHHAFSTLLPIRDVVVARLAVGTVGEQIEVLIVL